jgi:hypothetical protein
MEVRVHPEQEQLVFWILFSDLIRSSLSQKIQTIHVASHLGARAVGLKNFAARVQTIQARSFSSTQDKTTPEYSEKSTAQK